jgi:hypothetical protein
VSTKRKERLKQKLMNWVQQPRGEKQEWVWEAREGHGPQLCLCIREMEAIQSHRLCSGESDVIG